jgi:hypothetical protein
MPEKICDAYCPRCGHKIRWLETGGTGYRWIRLGWITLRSTLLQALNALNTPLIAQSCASGAFTGQCLFKIPARRKYRGAGAKYSSVFFLRQRADQDTGH